MPDDEREVSLDLAVDVDPADTVARLSEALVGHVRGRGLWSLAAGAVTLLAGPSRRPLAPDQTVLAANLVSGQRVVLQPGPPPEGTPRAVGTGEVVSLDIAAGPEAGRFVLLPPGLHTVGRSSSCDVVIDDATLSRQHLTVDVADDLTVTVIPNPDASNGTFVGGARVEAGRALAPDDLVHLGATTLGFRALQGDFSRRRDRLGQVPFNRVPYRRTVVRERSFEPLASPPERPRSGGFPLLAAALPMVGGLGIALLTGHPQFLFIMALTPLMLVGRWVSDRRSGRKSYAKEREAFFRRLEERAAEVATALEEERKERFAAAPDVAELARRARFHQPGLWERNRESEDFLSLRLGRGDLESKVRATLDRGGDPELREQGEARLSGQGVVHDVPVTVNLAEVEVLGVFGDAEAVSRVGTSLVLQATCLHSPEDLVVVAALPPGSPPDLSWLKWLPHTRSSTSPLEGPQLAVGQEQANHLLANLLATAAERLDRRPDVNRSVLWPKVLVVVHEDAEPDRAILSQLLDVAGSAGMVALWLGHSELELPRQCRATLASVNPLLGARSRLRFSDPHLVDRHVEIEGVRSDTGLEIARTLAPIRDASAATVTTAIPRRVLLLDTLGMGQPKAEELARRWKRPKPYGLRAPLGQTADGTFELDLVSDGPHALVAGTSGAGKSELLQSLVASLAASYSPERLNFLFIDYKGGASSAEFRDLPHTVGYVTNLDDRLSMRALTSLRAELRRRMAILEGRAKDLSEMLAVAPAEAPPSLVIVIDEFATLVKEIPDFMAGVVDVAQRGRSLGIHLVLATQRPAGAVNDQILANTNLRIALRVLDGVDSASVIDSKEAADIPVPLRGRAYARTGPRQLVAFQCAWSGAPFRPEEAARQVVVRPFTLGPSYDAHRPGPRRARGVESSGRTLRRRRRTMPGDGSGDGTGDGTGGGKGPTHLQVLVAAAAQAARDLELPPARRPWVEPLAEVVLLDDLLDPMTEQLAADPGRLVPLGLGDAPESQAQEPAVVDLEAGGGLVVFGTGGVGKTTALRTVAATVARQGGPGAVQLFGLDFASRALLQLTALPHCAAVATGDDPERVTRILTVLGQEVSRRRHLLAEQHADSLTALRALRGEPVVPRLILLVDGYGGLQAAFDRPDTYEWVGHFQRLVSEGRQVGIHAVIATDRRASFPGALLSAISTRMVLRMADPDEMSILGVPAKVAKGAELGAGRGFLGATELQVACVSPDPTGAAQADALSALGDDLRAASPAAVAPPLPELAETVPIDGLGEPSGPLRVPLAVADLTLDTVEVDLVRGHFVVSGPPQSGKSVALAVLAEGLRRDERVQLMAVGAITSPLAELALWDEVAFERRKQSVLFEELGARLETLEGGEVQVVLFVDEAADLDDGAARLLEPLARLDALRLAVAVDPAALARGFSGWLGAIRRSRRLLLLQPESRGEVEQLAGVKARFRPGQLFPPGRGVFVADRSWALVQVGLPGGPAVDPLRGGVGREQPRRPRRHERQGGER